MITCWSLLHCFEALTFITCQMFLMFVWTIRRSPVMQLSLCSWMEPLSLNGARGHLCRLYKAYKIYVSKICFWSLHTFHLLHYSDDLTCFFNLITGRFVRAQGNAHEPGPTGGFFFKASWVMQCPGISWRSNFWWDVNTISRASTTCKSRGTYRKRTDCRPRRAAPDSSTMIGF